MSKNRIPENAMYMVVEISDRSVCSTHYCSSMQEAVNTANDLLKEHVKHIGYGYEDDFKHGHEEGTEWVWANSDNLNTWCNYAAYR